MNKESKVATIAKGVQMLAGAFICFVLAFMTYEASLVGKIVVGSGRRGRSYANAINNLGDILEPVGGLTLVFIVLAGVGLFFVYRSIRMFKGK